ncbi:MAG: methyl-accepting chemotaxis protein, partial [Halobaculum sp.]
SVLFGRIRGSYALKLGGSFLVVLLAVGALGGYIAVTSTAALTADAEADLTATAETRAETLGTWVNNSQDVAQLVSTSAAVQSGDTERITPYVNRLVADDELTAGARAIHYIDASNTSILTSTLEFRVGGNPREEGAPWAQQDLTQVADDEVVVTAFNPTVANVTVITFVTPVPNAEDRAIVYVTTLQGVKQELEAETDTGFTVVVDENGKTVFNSKNASRVGEQHVGGPGVESAFVRAGLDGESGFDRMGDTAVGYAPTDELDWVVVSHEPESVVFGLQRSISRNIALLLLVAVVGLGLVGLTIGRNTVREVRQLADRASRMESGELDVTIESDREDELGDLYRAFDNMRASIRDSLEERIAEAERAREEMEAAKAESEAFSDHLEETARGYETQLEAVADGDLTRRLDTDCRSDAMSNVAVATNEMLTAFEETIADLQSFAGSVAERTAETAHSAEEIEETSADVARSTEQIAAGTERQEDRLADAAEELADLSATVEEVASSAGQAADRSERAVELGERGQERSAETVETIRQIDDRTAANVDRIRALDEQVDEIVEVVDLIDSIAEETNMLALNASIEAARAGSGVTSGGGDGGGAGGGVGSAGDGFAVVADEVKTLAEETRDATDDIERQIEAVRQSTAESVQELEATHELVDRGLEAVEDSRAALHEIVEAVEEANAGVQSIDEATDAQARRSEEVLESVEDVAELSRETSEEVGSVASAAEEQSASVAQIADNAETLSQQADRLRATLADFETTEGVAGAAGGGGAATAEASVDD